MTATDPEESKNGGNELHSTERDPGITGSSDLFQTRKQLKRWYKSVQIEKSQMQSFQRFRFQPTRAEYDLATVGYFGIRCWLGFDSLNPLHNPNNDIVASGNNICHMSGDYTYHTMMDTIENEKSDEEPNVLYGLCNTAIVLFFYGEYEPAEEIFLRVLEQLQKSLCVNSSENIDGLFMETVVCNLAMAKEQQGKGEEAEKLLLDYYPANKVKDFSDASGILHRCTLAFVLWSRGKYELAMTSLESFCKFFDGYGLNEFDWERIQDSYKYMLECMENNFLRGIEELSSEEEEGVN